MRASTLLILFALNSSGLSAQIITSVDPSATTRSGRVRILGSGFGASGSLEIGGQAAVVSRWTNTEVVGYVPETAPLGSADLILEAPGGTVGPVGITIDPRVADGRVKWRFLLDSRAVGGQPPAVGSDGSIYVDEGFGKVYAVDPDGGLKWIYDTTTTGSNGVAAEGPIQVMSDDTIIVAATLLGGIARIHAVWPDGGQRWVFATDGTTGIIAGPGIGPDGNIYAVTNDGQFGGIGAFSLDPSGGLRWSNPGTPAVGEYSSTYGHPIAFGADQLHMASKPAMGGGAPILWTFDFDGNQEWVSLAGFATDPVTDNQNRVIASNSFYGVTAFAPDGSVDWQTAPPGTSSLITSPTRAPNGDIYLAQYQALWSLSPSGSTRYYLQDVDHGMMNHLGVTPDGALVLDGGRQAFGVPGWVRAYSTTDGELQWQVDLPATAGDFVVNSRPSFSPDGNTAYYCVLPLGSNTDSYLYAIDLRDGVTFNRGDCNADGLVDISDPIRALESLFVPGSMPLGCVDACDSNDDGNFDIADAVQALTALFAGGADPAPPFGTCGTDPTSDGLECVEFAACP